jgi:hypothetical protein
MPFLFEREMSFIYMNGLQLARALHKRGGWDALNEAYAHPPASTEQVLHYRTKYLGERDEPTPVELPDLSEAVGESWTLAADDVLGELYVQTLFRHQLSFARARKPSRGWDGDRLHLYLPADEAGGAYVLVWSTVWDTGQDAAEFAEAYERVLRKKLDAGKDIAETTARNGERAETIVTIKGAETLAAVVRDGVRVSAVEGRPEAAVRAALERLRESTETDNTEKGNDTE